ncbi:MAG: hypothetical protein ACI9MR_003225, partial [Myxococcota bacterium]
TFWDRSSSDAALNRTPNGRLGALSGARAIA